MLYVLIALVTYLIGFQLGYLFREIHEKLKDIWNRDPEPIPEIVTPLPPGEASVFNQSSIITPITPYEEEMREKRRVEKLGE